MHTQNEPAAERIFLSAPDMTHSEREALLGAFDSNWIAPAGPSLNMFESQIRAIADTEAAVAVNSGTAALHLALLVLGVGEGDIVLCPTVTFVASANIIRYVGATPHFVDCESTTANIDPKLLEATLADLEARGRPAKAVITVDLYGSCADYTRIQAICDRFDVPIVEDAAEAIGATHRGRPAGSFGRLAAFSFNGNKLVTTGGGGALVGPKHLIDQARYLASQARDPELHYQHSEVGYAYGLSNLSAAVGSAQLDRLDTMIEQTRAIHRRYVDELSDIDGISFLPQNIDGHGNGWLSVATLDRDQHRTTAEICRELNEHNIEARPSWKPMHLQPLFADSPITGGAVAEDHFARGICLPSGSSMSHADQTRVISALRNALGRSRTSEIDIDSVDVRDERPQPHLERRLATY